MSTPVQITTDVQQVVVNTTAAGVSVSFQQVGPPTVALNGFLITNNLGSGEGGVTDGDKGDIVVSGLGTVYSIDTSVLSAYGRTLINDADAATARATLGLGTAATSASGDFAAASHSHAQSDVTDLVDDLSDIGSAITVLSGLVDGKAAAAHSHAISDVTSLQTSLDAKAASTHTHAQSDVTSLVADLAGKAATSHTHAISDVTSLQTTLDGKAAASHTHAISDTTGLQTALDGKAASTHSHAIGDVTNLQTTLDAKAPTSHTHAQSEVTDLVSDLAGKAAASHTHPPTDLSGLGTGVATFLATPSSANLAATLTDEIGTGKALFSDPVINAQTGTTYTLQASDNGKIVECSNAAAITVTVPASLGSGFNCVVVQLGAGQVTLSPDSTTLRNRNGLKTAGQYAAVSIMPTSTADTFLVSGDAAV